MHQYAISTKPPYFDADTLSAGARKACTHVNYIIKTQLFWFLFICVFFVILRTAFDDTAAGVKNRVAALRILPHSIVQILNLVSLES